MEVQISPEHDFWMILLPVHSLTTLLEISKLSFPLMQLLFGLFASRSFLDLSLFLKDLSPNRKIGATPPDVLLAV